ncbi:MAG: hypothetical protein R3F62_29770 [Planctomycetota bacterium]
MIDAELLALLRCPVDHSTLTEASAAELEALNAAQAAGKLKTQGGASLDSPLPGALIRADRARAYALIEGIPTMIPDEGIVVPAGTLPQ